MLKTLSNLLIKATTQTFGIITLISLVHLFIVEYLGISPWLLSNVWGCACIFVFMDSIVIANDLKVMEIKNKELEIRYNIIDIAYKTEKQEFREREKAFLHKENILLSKLSNQSTDIKSDMSSVCSRLSNMSNDINFLKSQSLNNSPEFCSANIVSSVPPLTVSPDLNSNMLSKIKDSSNNCYSRFNRSMPNLALDVELLSKYQNQKRHGLTASFSEVIKPSMFKE